MRFHRNADSARTSTGKEMTAEVLNFPQKKKDPRRNGGLFYGCLKCNSETFRLYVDGSVHCSGCSVPISNLRVEMK